MSLVTKIGGVWIDFAAILLQEDLVWLSDESIF
jgi:hypothetical protein